MQRKVHHSVRLTRVKQKSGVAFKKETYDEDTGVMAYSINKKGKEVALYKKNNDNEDYTKNKIRKDFVGAESSETYWQHMFDEYSHILFKKLIKMQNNLTKLNEVFFCK